MPQWSLRTVTLSSHVVYVIQEIEPFVRKMESRARRQVLCVLFQVPPQAQMSGMWEQVHGEERLRLPCLPEFLPVLEELGIRAEVTELEARPQSGFASFEEERDMLTRRLYVRPDTEEMVRLERALEGVAARGGRDVADRGLTAGAALHRGVGAGRALGKESSFRGVLRPSPPKSEEGATLVVRRAHHQRAHFTANA